MKKVLAVAVMFFVLFSVSTVYAYDWYAGGSLGFNVSDTDKDNSGYDFLIMPEIGYIISDKLDAGVGFAFSDSDVKTAGISDRMTAWGITPFIRYAVLRSGKFTLFARAQIAYSKADYDTADDESTVSAGFAPVVEFALSDRITVFTSFLMLEFGKTEAGGESTTFFGLNGDMNDLRVGFSVNF